MCGIVGITSSADVSFSLYYALYALQHRGQESAGIATFNGSGLCKHKGNGLVSEVFSEQMLRSLVGTVGIGHVRYPTTGENRPENIQPFLFTFRGHVIALAHNGNLVNYRELRAQFEDRGQIFWSTSDTEIISKIITESIRKGGTIEDAVKKCMACLKGSYSVVMLYDGDLYAFRDPHGIRPLCFGRTESGYMVASESVAIDALNGKYERDVFPGEMIHISGDEIRFKQIAVASRKGHCVFEFIYFARADSRIDGSLVYDVRRKIGAMIYEENPVQADAVCTVPDSGTAYAVGFSERSSIPFMECLIKNRYMGRTFIMPTQEKRERAVRIKLNPIPDHLRDRSIILVDDSIVRGTTSRRIIETMRDAGAREIHMRIGSPIIKAPCYLGVDMPTRAELIGSDKDVDEVRKSITATSLHYISIESLVRAIGLPRHDLCLGCLTGCYPVEIRDEQSDDRCITMVDRDVQTSLFERKFFMPERSQDWIAQAKFDLKAAVDNCKAGNYEWACFISEQAAEKSIKALYQYYGGDARGHSVEKLFIGLTDYVEISRELLSDAKRLDRLYIISRYPDGLTYGTPHEHFTKEDAHVAISSAGNILRFCQDILA